MSVTPPRRVTVAHSTHRGPAELFARAERLLYPDTNVTVQGEPGKWTVRRDVLPDDPPEMYVPKLKAGL